MGIPTLMLVTGPAGSGKTTLAAALASAVGGPLLSRDAIKEGMAAAHPGYVPATSDPLTQRTYELFFSVMALYVDAEVSHVAEAAFQHQLWLRGLEPLTGRARLKVVRCRLQGEVARARSLARLAMQSTRAAHADADHLATPRSFEHLQLDVPTLDVDTTDGWQPGLPEIIAFSRA